MYPLEIRHRETGSFASLLAAKYVVQSLREEARQQEEATPAADPLHVELATLLQRLFNIAGVAENCKDEDEWRDAYHMIFSSAISQRLAALRTSLGITFNYFDPDASYEEDVRAYVSAWREKLRVLKGFYPELERVVS